MKARKLFMLLTFAIVLIVGYSGGNSVISYASGLEDSFGDTDSGSTEGSTYDDGGLGEYIKSRKGLTGENLSEANKTLSPVSNFIGKLVGCGVVLLFSLVFGITVLDLLYITVPPLRNLLYKAGTDGTGGYTGGMPAGGYGMRGGMYGGMQAAGAGGAASGTAKPTQWISDEAVQCAAMLGGSSQAGPMMGAMGGMGGMGMAQGMPQQVPMKSVIATYFKKRVFFMILLAICVIVLTSSILLGTGVNLAKWGITMLDKINNSFPK